MPKPKRTDTSTEEVLPKAVLTEHITLNSWSDFLTKVAMAPDLKTWAFRGQQEAEWPLLSSLSRHLTDFSVDKRVWPVQEHRVLRIFKSKAHFFLEHVPPDGDSFQWLALMQHHGTPTRLLDLTWSPYVAAFFALERARGDAAIWALNTSQIMPFNRPVVTRFGKIHPWEITPQIEGNFEKFFLPGDRSCIVIANPRVSNKRLTAQSGTFLVPARLDQSVDQILASYQSHEQVLKKFVLSKTMRDEAVHELYNMNITHATLFPDLDGLARSMAFEFEFHWAFDTRTAQEHPGYEGYLGPSEKRGSAAKTAKAGLGKT